ncbi:HNH endonuclease signature motif containing protein [Ruminococcus flavefaciens]|uniref:HNH endonuclease signature motif containing protein n=1 Tax=Ruminococcus flavefaciens TaxID=1265 RepID=UPI00048FBBD6|nr:HNH endonuclease signature motif containing protein [Ruminococcus flavefaciens]
MIEALAKAAETAAKAEKIAEVKNIGSKAFDPRKPIDIINKEFKINDKPNFDPQKPLDIKTDKSLVQNEVRGNKEVSELIKDYLNDLKSKSECPDTLNETPFKESDLRKISPEENVSARKDFDNKKADLRKQWEEKTGKEWPVYKEDVYSDSRALIRQAGTPYDAHHIQPLELGGKNEVDNITPIHAKDHYDKQGVHAPNSPYSNLVKKIGG